MKAFKKTSKIVGRCRADGVDTDAAQAADFFSDVQYKTGLIGLATMWYWCQKG